MMYNSTVISSNNPPSTVQWKWLGSAQKYRRLQNQREERREENRQLPVNLVSYFCAAPKPRINVITQCVRRHVLAEEVIGDHRKDGARHIDRQSVGCARCPAVFTARPASIWRSRCHAGARIQSAGAPWPTLPRARRKSREVPGSGR